MLKQAAERSRRACVCLHVCVCVLRSEQGFCLAFGDTAACGIYLPLQGDVVETHPMSLNKCSVNH